MWNRRENCLNEFLEALAFKSSQRSEKCNPISHILRQKVLAMKRESTQPFSKTLIDE